MVSGLALWQDGALRELGVSGESLWQGRLTSPWVSSLLLVTWVSTPGCSGLGVLGWTLMGQREFL